MSEFRPIGKWISVTTSLRSEKTTEAGIVYKEEIQSNLYTWSDVVAVGCDVVEDVQPGDRVYWKLGSNKGSFYEKGDVVYDLVNVDDIEVIDRDETK
jgi:hypothetical protein